MIPLTLLWWSSSQCQNHIFLDFLLLACILNFFFQFWNSGYTRPSLFVGWGEGLGVCALEKNPRNAEVSQDLRSWKHINSLRGSILWIRFQTFVDHGWHNWFLKFWGELYGPFPYLKKGTKESTISKSDQQKFYAFNIQNCSLRTWHVSTSWNSTRYLLRTKP